MDETQFEMAQRVQEERLQQAIASRVQYRGVSATECENCGTDIPEGRRQAVPGCRYCVDCQAFAEVRK